MITRTREFDPASGVQALTGPNGINGVCTTNMPGKGRDVASRASQNIMHRPIQLILVSVKTGNPIGGVGSLKQTVKGLKKTIILIRIPVATTDGERSAKTMNSSSEQLKLRTLHRVQGREPERLPSQDGHTSLSFPGLREEQHVPPQALSGVVGPRHSPGLKVELLQTEEIDTVVSGRFENRLTISLKARDVLAPNLGVGRDRAWVLGLSRRPWPPAVLAFDKLEMF